MVEYIPITLQHGLNDVTYMDHGVITEVKWDVPIYFLRGNIYENIGTINDIRSRGTFNNNITAANSVTIGTVDELSTNRLFIMRTIDNQTNEEKKTLSKLRGGKSSNKRRKSSNKRRIFSNKKRKSRKRFKK
jgi:hypothetical protein